MATKTTYWVVRTYQSPENWAIFQGPKELGEMLVKDPAVHSVCQISRSTSYRMRRKDNEAFWDAMEDALFGSMEAAEE